MSVKSTIKTTAVPREMIWMPEILKRPKSISSFPKVVGNDRVWGPQIMRARLSRRVETPMVEIIGAR